MGHSFTWDAVASGTWTTAADWFDLTLAGKATIAPDNGDTAIIAGPGSGAITITGPGDASDLAVNGGVTFAGDFTLGSFSLGDPPFDQGPLPAPVVSSVAISGTLTADSIAVGALHLDLANPTSQADDNSTLTVGSGSMLTTGNLTVTSGALDVAGGNVAITGLLSVGLQIYVFDPITRHTANGVVEISDHANVHVGTVEIDEGSLSLDATSTLEIGLAGTATPGTITVDPGATLSGGPSFDAPTSIIGPLLNNGTVISSFPLSNVVNNGLLETVNSLSDVVNNATIVSESAALSSISGPGVIEVSNFLELGAGVDNQVEMLPRGTLWIANNVTTIPSVSGFAPGDEVRFLGKLSSGVTYQATGPGIGVLTLEQNDLPLASMTLLGTYNNSDFNDLFDGFDSVVTVSCFVGATRIRTRRGDIRVEELSLDDEIATLLDRPFRCIRWIGSRRIRIAEHPDATQVSPIRVAAHAFADAVPERDLYLSPDHAVFVDNALVPIKYLVNGETIARWCGRTVTYWHVELDRHDVMLAEGLPVESFLRTPGHASFAANSSLVALCPNFAAATWESEGCAPLLVTGPLIAKFQEDLRKRAVGLRRDFGPARRHRAGRR